MESHIFRASFGTWRGVPTLMRTLSAAALILVAISGCTDSSWSVQSEQPESDPSISRTEPYKGWTSDNALKNSVIPGWVLVSMSGQVTQWASEDFARQADRAESWVFVYYNTSSQSFKQVIAGPEFRSDGPVRPWAALEPSTFIPTSVAVDAASAFAKLVNAQGAVNSSTQGHTSYWLTMFNGSAVWIVRHWTSPFQVLMGAIDAQNGAEVPVPHLTGLSFQEALARANAQPWMPANSTVIEAVGVEVALAQPAYARMWSQGLAGPVFPLDFQGSDGKAGGWLLLFHPAVAGRVFPVFVGLGGQVTLGKDIVTTVQVEEVRPKFELIDSTEAAAMLHLQGEGYTYSLGYSPYRQDVTWEAHGTSVPKVMSAYRIQA